MATDLTTIFGTAINVNLQPVIIERQYDSFPGAHGLTAMHLGSRGYPLTITGTIAVSGTTYAQARANMCTAISAIQQYLFYGIADYSFYYDVYYNVLFDNFVLLPDGEGKLFYWTPSGLLCRFIMYARCLI